jgi:hypothetical protein
VIVLCLFFGCNGESEKLKSYLNESEINHKGYSYAVIIPYGGCSSCVKKAFDFLHEHYNNPSVLFVISNVNNSRLVRLKMGTPSNSENVVIDDTANHLNNGLNSMYSYIVYISNGGKFDIRVADPYKSEEWNLLEDDLKKAAIQ